VLGPAAGVGVETGDGKGVGVALALVELVVPQDARTNVKTRTSRAV